MTDKRPPAGEGWNAPGTCGGGYWRVNNGIYEMWPPDPTRSVTIGAGLTIGPALREGAVSETDASARPIPPNTLSGSSPGATDERNGNEA